MEQNTGKWHEYWNFKQYEEYEWFRFLIFILLILTVGYFVSHRVVSKSARYEYAKLDSKHIEHLNRIYFDSIKEQNIEDEAAPTAGEAGGDLPSDSLEVTAVKQTSNTKNPNSLMDCACEDSLRCNRAIQYLQLEFNNKIDSTQLDKIRKYICSAQPLEAISFLMSVRLQIESYFWLTGPEVYFEIVFWSWFGVIASLLFNLGAIARNRTTNAENKIIPFDATEIPSQIAKFLYAPLCTLAVVLGYNYFQKENIADISSSKGVIVFAFIGGFYSSRLIAFLDRLKEVLLPHSGTSENVRTTDAAKVPIEIVGIEITLDETGIDEDDRNDILETGFAAAIVTLRQGSGEPITATRIQEDQANKFEVSNILPGEYEITVQWTGEINGRPINLGAKETKNISKQESNLIIALKKQDTEG